MPRIRLHCCGNKKNTCSKDLEAGQVDKINTVQSCWWVVKSVVNGHVELVHDTDSCTLSTVTPIHMYSSRIKAGIVKFRDQCSKKKFGKQSKICNN